MNRAIQVGILLIVFVSSALPTPQQKATRVLVLKKEHKMELFSGETVIKTYTVALGRGGLAPKQRQGDHLTPEGLYEIDPSRVNAKPAMQGHFKTGHSRPGTLDVVPIAALFCKSHF
jgi:murein L,D-transpeptidase YafK